MIADLGAAIVAALPVSSPRALRLLVLANTISEYRHRRSPQVRRMEELRAAFYNRVWREAASSIGASVTAIPDNVLEVTVADGSTRVNLNETEADDIITLRLAGNKSAVHRILETARIPMPAYLEFGVDEWRLAEIFLSSAKGPCVVKPARSGSEGRGVTTGVRDRRGLVLATAHAAVFGSDLLIEHEVKGENYRLLFLDGVLLDAFVRRPPSVSGDGIATVGELVRRENHERQKVGSSDAQTILAIDADMILSLRREGLSLRSVPSRGRVVILKNVVNDNAAHQNEGVREHIAESIVQTARVAAFELGIRLAGVDIITRDLSRPLEETGGVVLEVNTTPGLYHHYRRTGRPADVAVPILSALLGVPIVGDSGPDIVDGGGPRVETPPGLPSRPGLNADSHQL